VRVLGVDPGLTRCGVGVVEGSPGRVCTLVAYYVVHSAPEDELPVRLLHLDRSLADLIAEHRPDSVAVERVFSQHNVRTVMGTAQAGAVAVLGAARAGLPVQMYTPSEVKAGRPTRRRSPPWSPGCCGCPPHPGRRTRPTRSRWRSATSGGAGPGPG